MVPRIKVLVVDDQEMVRTALCAVIDRRPDLQVVGSATDGGSAVSAATELHPDVVLMDVRMPGMDGVTATVRILRAWPHPSAPPAVLMLTTFDLDVYVHGALRAGARGFLLKNSSPDQLTEAIRAAATPDGAALSPAVTQRLIRTFAALPPSLVDDAPTEPSALAQLTTREREVLGLLAEGLSNAEIADGLGLSESNVKSRVNRILSRLGVRNRV